jgi:hypothetical protein
MDEDVLHRILGSYDVDEVPDIQLSKAWTFACTDTEYETNFTIFHKFSLTFLGLLFSPFFGSILFDDGISIAIFKYSY